MTFPYLYVLPYKLYKIVYPREILYSTSMIYYTEVIYMIKALTSQIKTQCEKRLDPKIYVKIFGQVVEDSD
jgi:hypothetical protein